MPEQHHFPDPFLYQAFNLPYDGLRLPAALPAPHIGDDTVTAEVIAPKHDIDAAFKRKLPVAREVLDDLIRVLPDIHDHSSGICSCFQELRQLKNVVGPEYKIHKRIAFPDLFHDLFFLHHTAAEADDHFRILFFCFLYMTQVTVKFRICILPHGTRIKEHQVRIFCICLPVTDGLQHSQKFF